MPKKLRNRASRKRYPVWYTRDIITDLRHKHKLHYIWKKSTCLTVYKAFSDLRANLKHRIMIAYNSHLCHVERNIRVNPRQFWQHISTLRCKGGFEPTINFQGQSLSGIDAANAFADFFASVFLPETPDLNVSQICALDTYSNSNSVSLTKFSTNDVERGISKLKLSSSVGPDNIPANILKLSKASIAKPLCHIFNLSLSTGKYPTQWKLSRVTPIPKTGVKSSVEDYRPIAILSAPAKVFEHILYKEIQRQVDIYMCNEQHGFRNKKSVNTNLLTLVEFISSEMDRGQQVHVLYFDFRKAFDRINNDILLRKLSAIGFTPSLLLLIADYLRDRQQFVRLGSYNSHAYHTRSGVSQGSILGPLLFLVMINDLPQIIKHAKCLLYADDLKIYATVNSVSDCIALQRDVDALSEWAATNKMEFNTSKCQIMSFGRMRSPIQYDYSVNNESIAIVSTVKDLGVLFDSKLTFHTHIISLAKESFRRLGFVLRNCQGFKNQAVIRLLFNALVRCKLETSACVWNPHEVTYTLMLEKVQKAFLRYLYKHLFGYYPYMYPTKFILGCLNFNSLKVRRSVDQITTAYKIIHGYTDASDLHAELCQFFVPNNYNRSRKHKLFNVPFCRTVARSASPIPRMLTMLNALVETNPGLDLFADEWKTIMLECLRFCEKTE